MALSRVPARNDKAGQGARVAGTLATRDYRPAACDLVRAVPLPGRGVALSPPYNRTICTVVAVRPGRTYSFTTTRPPSRYQLSPVPASTCASDAAIGIRLPE